MNLLDWKGNVNMSVSSSTYRECTILWSTQGGRSKACARRTARLLRSRGMTILDSNGGHSDSSVMNYGCTFDEYGIQNLLSTSSSADHRRLMIMFVSTTGDAEHCDSIQETWKALLQKSLRLNSSNGIVEFAMFALGDRAYGPTAFCAAGRKLATRLLQLGQQHYFQLFCPIGYGDDGTPNGGVFADLDIWLDQHLLPKINNIISSSITHPPHSISQKEEEERVFREQLNMNVQVLSISSTKKNSNDSMEIEEWQTKEYHDSYFNYFKNHVSPKTAYHYDPNSGKRLIRNNDNKINTYPLTASVTINNRITASDWIQDTRHLQLQVQTSFSTNLSSATTVNNDSSYNNHILPYEAGDVATILPSNSPAMVSYFISVLPTTIQSLVDEPLQIDNHVNSSSSDLLLQWPKFATLRGILTHCADIASLPEREDLHTLAYFCHLGHPMGKDQKEKLISLSETDGASLFGDYIIRQKRNWADVLYDFDSIRHTTGETSKETALLTLQNLLTILPKIMPRHFSIASAPSTALLPYPLNYLSHANTNSNNNIVTEEEEGKQKMIVGTKHEQKTFNLDLCVAVVGGKTNTGRSYKGLCSNYLSNLKPSTLTQNIIIWIRPGSFSKLPRKPLQNVSHNKEINGCRLFEQPVMLIGAGTGIAPLRSLILEREAIQHLRNITNDSMAKVVEAEKNSNDVDSPTTSKDLDNTIVFGCRKESKDFYYEKEWKELVLSQRLRLLTAFSRDPQPPNQAKSYVQKIVREVDDGNLIINHMIENNGAVYIAGGAKMARAVKDEILECLSDAFEGGEKDAKLFLKKLQRVGQFSVEAWS